MKPQEQFFVFGIMAFALVALAAAGRLLPGHKLLSLRWRQRILTIGLLTLAAAFYAIGDAGMTFTSFLVGCACFIVSCSSDEERSSAKHGAKQE